MKQIPLLILKHSSLVFIASVPLITVFYYIPSVSFFVKSLCVDHSIDFGSLRNSGKVAFDEISELVMQDNHTAKRLLKLNHLIESQNVRMYGKDYFI